MSQQRRSAHDGLIPWLGHVARCRYILWVHPVADRLSARWGWASRLMRFPFPRLIPFRRRQLHVARQGALGDVLMCTPALRELKQRNPSCHLTFYTDFQELAGQISFIDQVRPMSEAPPGVIWLVYEQSVPFLRGRRTAHRHLAQIIGDCLGLAVKDVRPGMVVRPELVERFRRDWSGLPRPLTIVNRRAGPWTPNKDWPDEYWDELIGRLSSWGTLIEVGKATSQSGAGPASSQIDLRGKTTLPELFAAFAPCDLHVGPDTGTVHIAAALGVPSVVIYGGYLHPDGTSYPGNINLFSPVECAPCWLRDPCPFAKKCLHQISPAAVEEAVKRLWASKSQGTLSRISGARIDEKAPGRQRSFGGSHS